MKKIVCVLISILLCLSMVGCGDTVHATAEISTSTGKAYIIPSYNGSNVSMSGNEYAIDNSFILDLPEGETAKIHFWCDTCGHDEEVELASPSSKLFSCECSEEYHSNGTSSVREYLAVIINTATTPIEEEAEAKTQTQKEG